MIRSLALWFLLFAGLAFVYRWIFSGQVLAGRDVYRLFIPDTDFLLRCIHLGHFPLWNPYERLGQPFLATMYSRALYPVHLLAAITTGPVWATTAEQVFNSALAAVGTYLFMKRLRTSLPAAVLSAGAFAIGPMMVHLGIQQNLSSAMAWTGFIMLASIELAATPSAKSCAKLVVFFTMSLLAGSPETLIWQGILSLSLVLTSEAKKKALVIFSTSVAWSALLGAVVLLPASEFALQAVHASSAVERFQWSTPGISILSLGWFGADLPKPSYSGGEQNFVPTVFLGTLVVALWLVSMLMKKKDLILKILTISGLLFALLSMGAHLWPSKFLLNLPPFNLFRYPSKYLAATGFCVAIGAGAGLDLLAKSMLDQSLKKRMALVIGTIAIISGAAILSAYFLPMRQGAKSGAMWISAFLSLLGLVLLLIRPQEHSDHLQWAVGALVVFELMAAHFVLSNEYWLPAKTLQPDSTYAKYLGDDFSGRVSVVIQDTCARTRSCMTLDKRYNIEQSLEVMVPRRNSELEVHGVDGYGAPIPARFHDAMKGRLRAVYDMVGTNYYVRRGEAPFDHLTPITHPAGYPGMWSSKTAMPRAWVVQRSVIVTPEKALAKLRDPDEPARKTVFLESGHAMSNTECESDVRLLDEDANHITFRVSACEDGYLVVSDQYFPGWHAKVNGQTTDLLRANYIMRAVAVKKGTSVVRMRYSPWTFKVGVWCTLAALLALFVIVLKS